MQKRLISEENGEERGEKGERRGSSSRTKDRDV